MSAAARRSPRGGLARAGDEARFGAVLERIAELPDEAALARFVEGLPTPVRRRILDEWSWQPHPGQEEPAGDWRVWTMIAGRGFGKTLAGAQWVWARVREVPGAAIALVGANRDDVVKLMVNGPSGIVRNARTGEWAQWAPSHGRVDFSNGARAFVYSGERPDKLRGPEHHFAWCDELAKWRHAEAAWDMLQMTMRLGQRPRIVVTTTPRPIALLRRIAADPETRRTGGRTADNAHSPKAYRDAMQALYGGTRIGRQELDGVVIDDVEGSLWPRALIEARRCAAPAGPMRRVVIGVDPPAKAGGDACGIVAAGMAADGRLYVLGDHSVAGLRPEGWARAVAAAAARWDADRVVAEGNNGGDMVESVLRSAACYLPIRMVATVLGKTARAEPVATLFERGAAWFAGCFPALEDELAGMVVAGGYAGPGRSPDRADACVWALTELMRAQDRAAPRITAL